MRRLTFLWAAAWSLGVAGQEAAPPVPPVPAEAPSPAPSSAPTPTVTSDEIPESGGSVAGVQPGGYLDSVGQKVKARWRQQYREGPPAPSSERLRVSFTLGNLMAESYLAAQAGDAQQFRNNNQEVLKLCSVLGLADKISSDVMASSKVAESEDWPELRKQILQTQQHIENVLNEQRDEDPAILMGLGLWVRLFDISTSLAVADPELKDKTVCIGSVAMLNELVSRFDLLTDATRSNEAIALIGGVLEMLQRHWTAAENEPTQELVQMTYDKLKFVISKVEAK